MRTGYKRQRIDGAFYVALRGVPVRGPYLSVRDAITGAREHYAGRHWTIHRDDSVPYVIGPPGQKTGNKRHHWEVRVDTTTRWGGNAP